MAETAIASVFKKKKGDRNQALEKKRDELLEDVKGRDNKVPKGTLPLVIDVLREEYDVDRSFSANNLQARLTGVDTGAIWKKVVENEFDSLWESALNRKENTAGSEANSSETTKSVEPMGDDDAPKDNLQTFTVPLRRILRTDLENEYERIVGLIEKAQVDVTNDMTELSTLIQKTVLQVRCESVMTRQISHVLHWTTRLTQCHM